MTKIKLIGINGDHLYDTWLNKLVLVLKDLKIPHRLEEINEVDEILGFNIKSIPALVINDDVLLEQNNRSPEMEEIKTSIQEYLKSGNFQ